jgi:GntR family transcriptional regulator, transcriptional repressor for pyruvate dehydrogenase complex
LARRDAPRISRDPELDGTKNIILISTAPEARLSRIRFAPLRPESLSGRIAAEIRGALFSGKVRSGDFLGTEASLAREFGVSRMASRDALRALAATGIVEVRQGAGGGVRVARGNLERFGDALAIQLQLLGVADVEVIEAQMALESMSAELAAERSTAADRKRLRRSVEESADLVAEPERFTEAALGFHLKVVEASHNRILVAQLTALHHVLRPLYSRRTTRDVAARVVAAHRELLDRIDSGDAGGARRAMCFHLEGVRARGFAPKRKKRSLP